MSDTDSPSDRAVSRRPVATIYDIALEAGVSPSTVSRALNRPGRINAVTEQRIRDTADRLGYLSNPMARALPTGRTGTLALILSDITNPVYFDLVRGAEREASKEGFTLVLAETQESADTEFETARRMQASVDGIVLVGSRLDDDAVTELAGIKPVVLVNRQVDGIPDVTPGSRAGIQDALDHLRGYGHRSIAYLSGPAASWVNRERWRILFDSAVERGLSIVEIGPNAPTLDGGRDVLGRVLASGVTAVFAYNDLMAMGLMRARDLVGATVPGRLSVVGFDDIFGAELISPALTTIRSPLGVAGETAVRRLLHEVDARPWKDEPLVATFVARASSGPPQR